MEKIAASILGQNNKSDLVNKLIKNNIKQIHYDVMDGLFVNNKSLPVAEILEIIDKSNNHISDVHLMTIDPINQINKLDGKVDFITFHIEADFDIKKLLNNRKSKIGFSIKPNTTVKSIKKYLKDISHILVMSVEPGKGGQIFINESLNKIKEIKKINPNLIIQVDGGINDKNAYLCFEAGASSVVSGSFLLNNLNPKIQNRLIKKVPYD